MVPEAAEAIDGGQHDSRQAQVPAEEGGDKGEGSTGLSPLQGCPEGGIYRRLDAAASC